MARVTALHSTRAFALVFVAVLALTTPLVQAVVVPPSVAQSRDGGPIPDELRVIGDVVNPIIEQGTSVLENETGEDLTGEDVDITLHMNITNAEFDLLGIIFGGGKVQADFRVTGHFEFRAISLGRLDEAMSTSSDYGNVSVKETFGVNTSRVYLTAEEFRLVAGAALLQAFSETEARAAADFIRSSLPGVSVLASSFAWSNLVAGSSLRERSVNDSVYLARDSNNTANDRFVPLREPPLILDATLELRYLDRFVLTDLLADFLADDGTDAPGLSPEDVLKASIKENRTAPILEQNAFSILGFDQLLDLQAPPGWRLNVTLTVPKGFTIEDATDELLLAQDRRSASYYADGSTAIASLSRAGIMTLSSRALVVPVILVAVVLAGLLLRVLVENGARLVRHVGMRVRTKRLKVS